MPIQIFFIKGSPESNPVFNEKARNVMMEMVSKRDELYKKHGIKELGYYVVPAEHVTIVVDEAQSLDAFQKLLMEPEFVGLTAFCSIETKVAFSLAEVMNMVKSK